MNECSLTHEATCARLTISRCVLEDNVETRRKTDAVPVYGDQHCCYEDSLPGHSPSGPSSSEDRSSEIIRDHPRPMSQ